MLVELEKELEGLVVLNDTSLAESVAKAAKRPLRSAKKEEK